MNGMLSRARLFLVGGATLVFLGGLLVAIAHWNRAETDRAFVDAAAQAARNPAPVGGVRFWAPAAAAMPETTRRIRLEAAERLRQIPTLTAPVIQAPALPLRPPQPPRGGTLPGTKPPAAP